MGTVQIQHTYECSYPRRLIQAHLFQLYIYFFFILSSVKFSVFIAHQGDPSIRENTLPGESINSINKKINKNKIIIIIIIIAPIFFSRSYTRWCRVGLKRCGGSA